MRKKFIDVVNEVHRGNHSNWKRKVRAIRNRMNGEARAERRATRDFFLKQVEYDKRIGVKPVKHLLETEVAYTGRVIGIGQNRG